MPTRTDAQARGVRCQARELGHSGVRGGLESDSEKFKISLIGESVCHDV